MKIKNEFVNGFVKEIRPQIFAVVIKDCYQRTMLFCRYVFDKDKGPYDEIMSDIWYACENYPLRFDKPRTKWYLIGADTLKSKTMDHEIAHGLYYTNKQYKKNCDELISKIKPTHYNKLKKILIMMGYVGEKKIIDDEIQAFMSTGLYNGLEKKELKKYEKGFIENFKNFNK